MIRAGFLKSRFYRPLLAGVVLAAAFVVFSLPVSAQDVDARLKRIENEIQTLSRAVFKGEQPPAGSLMPGDNASAALTANTELRLQQIEMELRSITGKVEQQGFQSRQYQERTEKMLIDLEMRINELESRLGDQAAERTLPRQYMPPPQKNGGVSPSLNQADMAGPGFSPDYDTAVSDETAQSMEGELADDLYSGPSSSGQLGTLRQPVDRPVPEGAEVLGIEPSIGTEGPVEIYERAFSFLRERNYDDAEKIFSDFLKRYPGHELAANAKYWLGETFYVRNNYERAARVFAEAYQKYPDGPKGPDNLLKLGMSLAGMGKGDDACVTFSQLKKEYPASSGAILMRVEKEMQELGCQQF